MSQSIRPRTLIRAAPLLPALILTAAVLAAYATALPGGFVWIDHVEIEQGGYRVQSAADFAFVWTHSLDQFLERREGQLSAAGGYFRPVYALEISLTWALWGARPWAFHLENLLWHAAVALGLWRLGRRMLWRHPQGDAVAFWAALLFAVHPLGVHSVTWISGRKDLMCAAFAVASLLAFARVALPRDTQPDARVSRLHMAGWIALAALMFLLSVLSKEAGFVVPLVAAGWYAAEVAAARRDATATSRRRAWNVSGLAAVLTLLACAVGVVAWRSSVLGAAGLGGEHASDSVAHSAGTFARLWWTYVGRVLFPLSPTIVDRWPLTRQIGAAEAAAWLGWAVCGAALVFGFVRARPWVMPLGWYVLWLAPASGLVALRHLYAERYLYPASWGLLALLVLLAFAGARDDAGRHAWRRRAPRLALGCLALAFATVTACENRFWRSDLTLFAHAIEQDPHYVEGHVALAGVALGSGDHARAEHHSQLALRSAADDRYASYVSPFMAHTNLGLALYHLGRFDEAAAQFARARDARPDNAIAHYHLGLCAFARGDVPAAREHYETALRLKPGDYLAQSNLAYVHLVSGRPTDCIALLRPLVEKRPDDPLNRANLATSLLLTRDFAGAEPHFEALVRLQPGVAVHLAKLAWVEHAQGKHGEAASHLNAAVELDPNHPTVREVRRMMP